MSQQWADGANGRRWTWPVTGGLVLAAVAGVVLVLGSGEAEPASSVAPVVPGVPVAPSIPASAVPVPSATVDFAFGASMVLRNSASALGLQNGPDGVVQDVVTGGPTQLWVVNDIEGEGNEVRLAGTQLCLEVPDAAKLDDGAQLAVADCAETDNQRFFIDETYAKQAGNMTLRIYYSDQCVSAEAGAGAGTPVRQLPCTWADETAWDVVAPQTA